MKSSPASGIDIEKCSVLTKNLIRLYDTETSDSKVETASMDVLRFLWDQSNLLHDLVHNRKRAQGRSGQDYFDGVKLGELAYSIAVKSREFKYKNIEELALRVRLKSILQVQGHYHHIIGPAMLEHSTLLCELGKLEEASDNYECIIEDFSWLLDEFDDQNDLPGEEDRVSLESLLQALKNRLEPGDLPQVEMRQMNKKMKKVELILARE